MMYEPKVSLVVVSRNRPKGLRRILNALRFQTYDAFEVIIVSNMNHNYGEAVRFVHFDEPNISVARNIGIKHATGELIAFCDDDAVPEPVWLEKLIQPFIDPKVGIAGGFVRGRNGFDYQWTACQVDKFGNDCPLTLSGNQDIYTFGAKASLCPRVQGTNCIFRKDLLTQLGGFDENFAFFLEETDLCYRASLAGWLTAIVPIAEVQHGFEESDRRTAERVPKSLFFEGRSKAYYCKKHATNFLEKEMLADFVHEQRNRLIKLMVSGFIQPFEVQRLLETLKTGIKAGKQLEENNADIEPIDQSHNFKKFLGNQSSAHHHGQVLLGTLRFKKRMIRLACDLSKKGIITTVFCWSYTTLFHHRFFDDRGFWMQTGGLFGMSIRKRPYVLLNSLSERGKKEAKELKTLRKIKKTHQF